MREIGSWLEHVEDYFDVADNGLFHDGELFLSGRIALQYILHTLGVHELYIPSYFCPDVTEYVKNDPSVSVKEYPVDVFFNLDLSKFDVSASISDSSNALLMVDFFGKRDSAFERIQSACFKNNAPLIVDRTHSLFNTYDTHPSITFASIRKLLVHLPGAIMTGIKYTDSYGSLNIQKYLDTLEKKQQYLKLLDKRLKITYLSEMNELEFSLGHYDPNPKALQCNELTSIITAANLQKMGESRKKNYNTLFSSLSPKARSRIFPLKFKDIEIPAYLLLQCESKKERDSLKEFLINSNIYPPMHWNNGTTLSTLLLSIPIDHRYAANDMERAGSVINAFL